MITPEALYDSPNALAPHYGRFRVDERLLLTGHSHQAWPDAGMAGQVEAWDDAARFVDDKWERAFQRAERVRTGWRLLLGDGGGDIALGTSTHELVTRFLSALPLRERSRIVTTDGEFHTIRRLVDRLAEEGVEVIKVASVSATHLAERLAAAIDDRTAVAMVSAVLFRNAHIVPHLASLQQACARHGTELLVDAYHALDAIPFRLQEEQLTDAFVVGGGYKYCQLGEGNCFLRVPPACSLRPIMTGWFSEFSALDQSEMDGQVTYGTGADRFAGATYDPTSHYRAAAVFDFFATQGLAPALLREVSQHQVGVLAATFDALDLSSTVISRDRDMALEQVAGFLALRSPQAGEISRALRARGVYTDYRGDTLRLGPAPYLSDRQLRDAVGVLGEVAATFPG